MSKKRKYSDSYIKFGFVNQTKDNEDHPQCVVCYKVLANAALKPSKLTEHLTKCHPAVANKSPDYFERLAGGLKRQKLDNTGAYRATNENAVKASFTVSYLVAKSKKHIQLWRSLFYRVQKLWWKKCVVQRRQLN